jgi:excisionase family DNA binding protein
MNQIETLVLELHALIKKSEQSVYSADEAAAILECTRASLEAHLRSGRLPGLKIGRSWVLPVDAFTQAINALAISEAAAKRDGLAKARQDAIVAVQVVPQPRRGRRRPPIDLKPYLALLDSKD